MFCPKCGTQNDDNAFRCVKCGEMIQPVPAQLRPQKIADDAGMRVLLPVGRSGLAIAAGYAGLFAVLMVPAPIALVLGILAIIDIKRHPDKRGMERAIFALIMGGLFSTLLLVWLILAGFGARF